MILMTDTKYFTVSRAMLNYLVSIFVFIYGYSELVFSMMNFSSAHTQEIGSQFAYVVMSVIPMIIIYIVFHKQIEKGMLSGAIKG